MSTKALVDARASRPLRRIAVCGAGVAGLALAARLARRGAAVTVLEARDESALETEGVFLTLAPNGMNGLRLLDLHEPVRAGGIATTAMEIRDERGRRLALIDQSDDASAFGAHSITIRRGLLAKLLLARARADGVTVRLGARVVGVTEASDGVDVVIEGGETMRFDLLAACDGLRSRVRDLVFPGFPKPRFTGLIGTGGFVDAPVASTNGTLRMTFGREAFFGYIKADGQPVFWFNSYPSADAIASCPSPEAYAERLRRLHRADPPDIGDILAAVARVDRDYPVFDVPELPVWHAGRVVLVGDAAHAVGPHAGQGASMAIEDAMVLAACLEAETEFPTAFAHYERRRRARVREVVRLTAHNGAQKRASGWLSRMIRNLVMPLAIPFGARMMRQVGAYRVDQDLPDPAQLPG
jgi:2-polyprenyl-6-methoxyphenol hydroxylase-like FAD-dependent oxidoreductase